MPNVSQIKTGISLLRWQVPKGKLNPKTLGYVLPNGNVNFSSHENAMNYAKNAVIKALKSDHPYERGIVVNDRQIIADIRGTGNTVNFWNMNIENCSVVHGHPNSTPISIGDYDCLMKGALKENIAYNSLGEYSKLTRNANPKVLSILPQKVKGFVEKCIHNFRRGVTSYEYGEFMKPTDTVIKEQSAQLRRRIKEFYDSSNTDTQKFLAYWLKRIDEDLVTDLSELPKEFQPVLRDFINLSKSEFKVKAPLVHRFWTDNAGKFGVKYETNFSNLV